MRRLSCPQKASWLKRMLFCLALSLVDTESSTQIQLPSWVSATGEKRVVPSCSKTCLSSDLFSHWLKKKKKLILFRNTYHLSEQTPVFTLKNSNLEKNKILLFNEKNTSLQPEGSTVCSSPWFIIQTIAHAKYYCTSAESPVHGGPWHPNYSTS